MAEQATHDREKQSGGFESTTVGVFRTATVVKGGRRFSFGAMVVCGDRHGQVGMGYAKGNEVPPATEKAEKAARKALIRVPLVGGTIPHTVTGKFGSSSVKLVPASPGTGVVAGGAVRAVLELAGIRDCLTKAYGNTNSKNLLKATLNGLSRLRSKQAVEQMRGVVLGDSHVEQIVKRGEAFMPSTRQRTMAAPVNTRGDENRAQRGGRGPRRGKRGADGDAASPSGEGSAT